MKKIKKLYSENKFLIISYIVGFISLYSIANFRFVCRDWDCLGFLLIWFGIFGIVLPIIGIIYSIKKKKWVSLVLFAMPAIFVFLKYNGII